MLGEGRAARDETQRIDGVARHGTAACLARGAVDGERMPAAAERHRERGLGHAVARRNRFGSQPERHEAAGELGQHLGVDRLGTAAQHPQAAQVQRHRAAQVVAGDVGEGEVGREADRAAVARDRVEPEVGVLDEGRGREVDHLGAVGQRRQHLADEPHVVVQRQPAHAHVTRGDLQAVLHDRARVGGEVAVAHDHALGRAGGARGELQEAGVVGGQLGLCGCGQAGGGVQRVVANHRHTGHRFGHEGMQALGRDDAVQLGHPGDLTQQRGVALLAPAERGRRERYQHQARAHARHEGGDEARRVGRDEREPLAGHEAPRVQLAVHREGGGHQLGVAALAARATRGQVGVAALLAALDRVEQCVERRRLGVFHRADPTATAACGTPRSSLAEGACGISKGSKSSPFAVGA